MYIVHTYTQPYIQLSNQALIHIMKSHVMEDRGQEHLPIINEAVYAAAAAMILHNNLGDEAMDLVLRKVSHST